MFRVSLACLLISACYSPKLDPCTITCTEGCPPGWDCAGDNYCHETVNEPTCNEGPEPMPPLPPDGGRPFADASVPKPDADLNDAMCVNTPLLMNAGYDDSTGTGSAKTVPNWTAFTTADGGVMPGVFVRTSAELGPPYNTTMTGPYAAKHGGTGISSVSNRLCQDVTVPAGADTLRLSLSAWVTTQETTTTQRYDFLNFELTTTGGGALETIVTPIDNLMVHAQWTPFNFQAMGAGAPYAGQTIRFCALGVADPSLPTELRFDTLVLEAVDCP